jgi:hypothetical protein
LRTNQKPEGQPGSADELTKRHYDEVQPGIGGKKRKIAGAEERRVKQLRISRAIQREP